MNGWLIEGLIPTGSVAAIADLDDPAPEELLEHGFDVVLRLHGRGDLLDGSVMFSCHWRPGLAPGCEPPGPFWIERRGNGFERIEAP
jgi:hypothetical protein